MMTRMSPGAKVGTMELLDVSREGAELPSAHRAYHIGARSTLADGDAQGGQLCCEGQRAPPPVRQNLATKRWP